MVQTGKAVEDRTLHGLTDADWAHHMALNLTTAFHACRAVLPGMAARGHGRIVNIASVLGLRPVAGPLHYAAAKAGIDYEYRAYGTVTDQLDAVTSGEVDAALGAISITGEREAVVDFTQPMYDSGIGILAAESSGDGGVFAVLRVLFTRTLLFLLLGLAFLVVVLGGVGQLAGTVYAAFGLGILNKFLEGWAGAVLAKIAVLLFIVVFIQKRPQGIFAMKGRSAEA